MKKIILAICTVLLALPLSAAEPTFKYGPWIQAVTETGFTVLFRTGVDVMAWIEVAPDDGTSFEAEPRTPYYQTIAGRRYCGKEHCIKVTGLEPGKKYRYRIYRQKLVDGSHDNAVHYSPAKVQWVGKQRDFKMKTYDASAKTCKFTMVCDIHQRDDLFQALLGSVKHSDYDFLVLNGDIVSATRNIDTTIKHTFGPITHLSANMPIAFVRGNHEGRGLDFHKMPAAFPTTTGEFYYTFRQGPVAFIVLDAGEDKPDSDVEYAGHARYDDFRAAQLAWLKEAVKEPSVATAPYKICLMHIPALKDRGSWYGPKWAAENFVPVLNEAGVNLMLSGHYHRYLYTQPKQGANQFPIVANSNEERLDVCVDEKGAVLNFYNTKGEKVRTLNL